MAVTAQMTSRASCSERMKYLLWKNRDLGGTPKMGAQHQMEALNKSKSPKGFVEVPLSLSGNCGLAMHGVPM
jgi:hypothetical protein